MFCSSSWVMYREVSPARFAENVSEFLSLETRSPAATLAFFLATAPSALRFSLNGATRRSAWTFPRPCCVISSRRLLAGTTLVLRNSMKTRSTSSSSASFLPPWLSHCPVLLAAATLRIGACSQGGEGTGTGAACTEETTPRSSLTARACGAKYSLGAHLGARGRPRWSRSSSRRAASRTSSKVTRRRGQERRCTAGVRPRPHHL